MATPKFLRISIDDPCHVPWDGMTPVDKERKHCSSCDRVITDFSKMSDDELMLFFTHSHGKICGRFSNHQLNRPLPLLPQKTQPAKWWRTMLLLPLTLFGKSARAQNDSTAQLIAQDSTVVQTDSVALNASGQDSVAIQTVTDSIEVNPELAAVVQDTVKIVQHHREQIFHLDAVMVTGTMIQTLGYCSSSVGNELFPDPRMVTNPLEAPKPVPDQVQIVAADSAFKNLTTEPPQKPADPPTPAQSSDTTDLSAVLPEKRRRFWRS